MIEKKIESLRHREFIDEYLFGRGFSEEIMDNPRYQTILWTLSNYLQRKNIKPFSNKSKEILDKIISLRDDTSISILEPIIIPNTIIISQYYIDSSDGKLKRNRIEKTNSEEIKTISTYNGDGIEDMLILEQRNINNSRKYFSKTTRLPNRADVIKIERWEENKGKIEHKKDICQLRVFKGGFEDINPGIDDIDPFSTMRFDLVGLPPIYRDLNREESELVKKMNGQIYPLSEKDRMSILEEYKRLNDRYGRTKSFEKGIAKLLSVRDIQQKK